MTVKLQDPDPSLFAPFGAFLEPPAGVGDRSVFSEWLEPVPGLSQQCHLNRVTPSTLPLTVEQVERHPHTSQLFLPMAVSHYLVTVMPSDAAGPLTARMPWPSSSPVRWEWSTIRGHGMQVSLCWRLRQASPS